jgi:hypothetical protein
MTTRPRQVSLRQMTLHFSCTVIAPQTGQSGVNFALAATSLAGSVSESAPGSEFNDASARNASRRTQRRR